MKAGRFFFVLVCLGKHGKLGVAFQILGEAHAFALGVVSFVHLGEQFLVHGYIVAEGKRGAKGFFSQSLFLVL